MLDSPVHSQDWSNHEDNPQQAMQSDLSILPWLAEQRSDIIAVWSGIRICSRPNISATRGKDIKDRVERYSMNEAAKTVVLNEFDHISFHRQNWFSGMRAARACDTPWQVCKTGRREASRAGTGKTACITEIGRDIGSYTHLNQRELNELYWATRPSCVLSYRARLPVPWFSTEHIYFCIDQTGGSGYLSEFNVTIEQKVDIF